MNKKINYILCVALSLLMVSCNETKKVTPESSEKKPEKESVTELIETNTDLSVSYYQSEEIFKNFTSNNVIGFYDNEIFFCDMTLTTNESILSINDNSTIDLPTDNNVIISMKSYNNKMYTLEFNENEISSINSVSSDLSKIENLIEDKNIMNFEISASGHIYTQSVDGDNLCIKKYDLSGNQISSINLNDFADISSNIIMKMMEAPDGSLYIVSYDLFYFFKLDSDFSLISESTFENLYAYAELPYNYNIISINEYNFPIVSAYDIDSESIVIYEYDTNIQELIEMDSLSDVKRIYSGNEEYSLFYYDGNAVYGYDIYTKTSTEIFKSTDETSTDILKINDNLYKRVLTNNNFFEFGSYHLENNQYNFKYSLTSTEILQNHKIRSNGLIQAKEPTNDGYRIHMKDVNSNTENIITILEKENCFISDITAVNNDTILAVQNNEENGNTVITVYNNKGEELNEIASKNQNDNINDIIISPDGRIFTYVYDDKMCFKEISPKEGKLIDTPIDINQDDYILACFDGNSTYDFFYSTETCVYGVDIDNNICKLVFDINQSDLPYDISILNFYQVDDKTMYISTAQSIYKLTQDDSINEITTINIGNLGGINPQIIDMFEKENPSYKINVIDYFTMESDTLSNDIDMELISGDTLDIITADDMDLWYDITRHNNKNAYVDFYTLMEQDEEFSKDDYMQNVMKAMETNGALYQIPLKFSVSTLLGKEEIYSKNKDTIWSLDDFNSYLEQNSDNGLYVGSIYTNLFMYQILDSDNFINLHNGTANYNNESVKKFISLFSEYEEPINNNPRNYPLQYHNIYDFNCLNQLKHDEFNGDDIYNIGIPEVGGNGAVISLRDTYSILKSSENVDAAWTFIKFLLSEEIQNQITEYNDFPLRKDLIDKKRQAAKDGSNEQSAESYNKQGELIKHGYPDDNILDLTMNIISNAETVYHPDFYVQDIISSEISSYQSGNISIDDATKNIQSRLSVYASERY